MIIETTANRFYRVWDHNQAGLDHVWFGVQIKKVKGAWLDKKPKARPGVRVEMVRKEASRVVEA